MARFLQRVRPARVLVGVVVWALFVAQLPLLDHLFPVDVPNCTSHAFFDCTDWTAFALALASIPVWYAVWAFGLYRLGGRWAALTPVVVTVVGFVLIQLGPDFSVGAVQLAFVVACFLVTAVGWDALAGSRTAAEVSPAP